MTKRGIFDTIIDEVNNKLKPDAILITGDLTDDELISQFEHAHLGLQYHKPQAMTLRTRYQNNANTSNASGNDRTNLHVDARHALSVWYSSP